VKPRVLACGGAVMDFLPGEGDAWLARPGGSAWNVAHALAALGSSVSFVGAISDDPFGQRLRQDARHSGIDVSFASRTSAPTALSVIHTTHPARYAFYAHECADAQFTGVDDAALEGARAAYFGGVTLLRAPATQHLLALADAARARGVLVAYDPNYREQHAETARASFRAFVPLADVMKVSQEDLAGLLPGRTWEDAVAELRADHPHLRLLVTLGEAGALLVGPGETARHGGYRVPVADTVGAGDASIAGYLHARLTRPDAPAGEHLAFALACAAAACTRPGAYAPTPRDVQAVRQELT